MAKRDYEKHILSDDIYTVSKDDGSKPRRFTDEADADAYYERLEREEVQDRIASTNERILEILEGKKSSNVYDYDSADDYDSEYEKRETAEAEQKRIANFKKNELTKYERLIMNGQRNGIPWNDVALTTSNSIVIRVLEGLNNKDVYSSLSSNENLSKLQRQIYWNKYYKREIIEEEGAVSYYASGCVGVFVGLIISAIIGLAGYVVLYIVFTAMMGVSVPTVWIIIVGVIAMIYMIYVNYFKY